MEKDQKQPQGGQPQSAPAQASAPKAKEEAPQLTYEEQYAAAQAKCIQRCQTAWADYYKKNGRAYTEYQDTIREIHEGERKAAMQAPQSAEEGSPDQSVEAFKAARLKSQQGAHEVELKLHAAQRKYTTIAGSFWDDVFRSVSDAVDDFWQWIIGMWEEPPVEGGGRGPRRLADPAWRGAFDPSTAAYYSGWNYGAQLY